MMKSKIALAVLLTSFALAPAGARPKSQAQGNQQRQDQAYSKKAKAEDKPVQKAAAPAAAAAAAATPQNRNDRYMDSQSMQFVTALWRIDPEGGIYVGKFDAAATLTIPDAPTRAKKLAFIDEWLDKFGKLNADKLSPNQRTDLAVLINKLKYDRWQLTTFREFEWNPADYNVAQPFDLILNTEYAAKAQRLRTILKRLADVPAYYQAAQAADRQPDPRAHAARDPAGAGHAGGAGGPRQGRAGIDPVAAGEGDLRPAHRERRHARCWPGSTS
jgi:hypothetical protein